MNEGIMSDKSEKCGNVENVIETKEDCCDITSHKSIVEDKSELMHTILASNKILVKQIETNELISADGESTRHSTATTNNEELNEDKSNQASTSFENLSTNKEFKIEKLNIHIVNKTDTKETHQGQESNDKLSTFIEEIPNKTNNGKYDDIKNLTPVDNTGLDNQLKTDNSRILLEEKNKDISTSDDINNEETNELKQHSTVVQIPIPDTQSKTDKLHVCIKEKPNDETILDTTNQEVTKRNDLIKELNISSEVDMTTKISLDENSKLHESTEKGKYSDRNKLEELIKEFNIDTEDIDKTDPCDIAPSNTIINNNIEKEHDIDKEQNKDEIANICLTFNTQTNAFEVNQDNFNKADSTDSEALETNTSVSKETGELTVEDDFLLNPIEPVNSIEDESKTKILSGATAPIVCINVMFNADTNKYELEQANTNEIFDNKSIKENTQDSINTIDNDVEEDGSIDQEMNTNSNIDEVNKKAEESQDDSNTFLKPSRSCTPSAVGTDDELSLKALINWYSDDIGKQVDENSKPIVFPPPSLEDTHLDFPEPQELRYHCGDCDKKFTTQYDIATHKCNKKCNDFTSFNKTLRKRRLSCPDPFESDVQDGELKSSDKGVSTKSIRLGVDLGPYSCPLCEKTLSRRSGLKIHLRRHNKDMPYQCEYCKKKFVVLYDLDRHMLTHLGEKRYRLMCEVCSRPFMSKDGLIQHKRIAHCGYAAYICDICQKPFNQEYRLWKHKKAEHEYGSEVKQSNVIDESLELLEEIEKPPGEKKIEPMNSDNSIAVNQIVDMVVDDSTSDKDPIELIGLNPMDIQLVELNTTDVLGETLNIPEKEQSKPNPSNDIQVKQVDLKQSLIDNSIEMTAVNKPKVTKELIQLKKSVGIIQKNATELELLGLNEGLLNEAYDLAGLADSNVANESVKNIENEMELGDSSQIVDQPLRVTGSNDSAIKTVKPVLIEVIEVELVELDDMNVIDDLTKKNKRNETKQILTSKQVISNKMNLATGSTEVLTSNKLNVTDDSIDLSEFKLDLNETASSSDLIIESSQVTTVAIPLVEKEKPCVLNGKINLVDVVVPLSIVDDSIEVLDLNHSNVLLL